MKNIASARKGFTLTELVVVIGIFSIIAVLTLAKYPVFSSKLSLKRTSQEIALGIRQAQVFALSVREFSGEFPGYGVYFSESAQKSFIIFADTNSNNFYDGGAEKVQTFTIKTGDRISGLCGDTKKSPPGDCSITNLEIIFTRPNPIVSLRSGALIFSDGEITVTSSRGDTKKVVVRASGQISIE